MSYAKSFDGARLWFDVHGQDGDPVLLIAGNACDHTVWSSVVTELSSKHQVIVYDHRGTGLSEANFPAQWSTRDFARDAATIMHAAGFDRAHVYGHSMGGRIAQWLAVDYPQRTCALILGASSVGDKHGVPRPADATAAIASNDPITLQRMSFTDDWIAQNPESAATGAPNPCSLEAFMAHLKASASHDAWDALPSITSATLVIHGSEDQIALASNAEILAKRIPGARLLIVNGARHVYWAGFPEVGDAISRFFHGHRLCQTAPS
ncbi:alpha/beta fold hydrolase [Bradyrhizobium manausense]